MTRKHFLRDSDHERLGTGISLHSQSSLHGVPIVYVAGKHMPIMVAVVLVLAPSYVSTDITLSPLKCLRGPVATEGIQQNSPLTQITQNIITYHKWFYIWDRSQQWHCCALYQHLKRLRSWNGVYFSRFQFKKRFGWITYILTASILRANCK